jgi:hypothetical protein
MGPAVESRFALLDAAELEEAKEKAAREVDGGVPFVSTNDVLTSWFLQRCGCKYGLMAMNLRNRIVGHTEKHAGNYTFLIFYDQPDSASPGLIRQSVLNLKRSITKDRHMPGFWETATASFAMVTNWATFAKPNNIEGCQEDLHIPVLGDFQIDLMTVMFIFRSGPRGLALCVLGPADKLEELFHSSAPPFVISKTLE